MLTDKSKNDYSFKRFSNLMSTNKNLETFEEKNFSDLYVKPSSIWTNSDDVPENNPLLAGADGDEYNSIIKKYEKFELTYEEGTEYSFVDISDPKDFFDLLNPYLALHVRPDRGPVARRLPVGGPARSEFAQHVTARI